MTLLLLADVLQNPESLEAESNVASVGEFVSYLDTLTSTRGCDMRRLHKGCTKAHSIAKAAVATGHGLSSSEGMSGGSPGGNLQVRVNGCFPQVVPTNRDLSAEPSSSPIIVPELSVACPTLDEQRAHFREWYCYRTIGIAGHFVGCAR